jgi:hypothetical protein
MKFMITFIMAMLSVAAVAQSPSGSGSGLPKVAVPRTTGVLVMQMAKQGVTFQQIMPVMPSEIRASAWVTLRHLMIPNIRLGSIDLIAVRATSTGWR